MAPLLKLEVYGAREIVQWLKCLAINMKTRVLRTHAKLSRDGSLPILLVRRWSLQSMLPNKT